MYCPECGGDFRKVGIVTPKEKAVSPARFVFVWTLLFIPIALSLGAIMFTYAPRVVTRGWVVTATPFSGSFDNVKLHVIAKAPWGVGPRAPGQSVLKQMTVDGPVESVSLSSVPPMAQSTLTYIPTKQRYFIPNSPVNKGVPDADVIRAWLVSNAVDPDAVGLNEDVAVLQRLVVALGNGRTSVSTPRLNLQLRAVGGSSAVHPAYRASIIAFWLLIYIAGIVAYLRIRRRTMRRPQHERDGMGMGQPDSGEGWS